MFPFIEVVIIGREISAKEESPGMGWTSFFNYYEVIYGVYSYLLA
jgi:hypothetical protein